MAMSDEAWFFRTQENVQRQRAPRRSFTDKAGTNGAAIAEALLKQRLDLFALLALKEPHRSHIMAKLEMEMRIEVGKCFG